MPFKFKENEKVLANQILEYLKRLDEHPFGLPCPGSMLMRQPLSPFSYASDAKFLGGKSFELYHKQNTRSTRGTPFDVKIRVEGVEH